MARRCTWLGRQQEHLVHFVGERRGSGVVEEAMYSRIQLGSVPHTATRVLLLVLCKKQQHVYTCQPYLIERYLLFHEQAVLGVVEVERAPAAGRVGRRVL